MQNRIEKQAELKVPICSWHPFAIDSEVDYSKEVPTLVEFQLERIPSERRSLAFRMNDEGWAADEKHRVLLRPKFKVTLISSQRSPSLYQALRLRKDCF
jgi:hypothetical protein